MVNHSAVLVYKGSSIYEETNLTKWRHVRIKIQVFIDNLSPKKVKQQSIIEIKRFESSRIGTSPLTLVS